MNEGAFALLTPSSEERTCVATKRMVVMAVLTSAARVWWICESWV